MDGPESSTAVLRDGSFWPGPLGIDQPHPGHMLAAASDLLATRGRT